MKYRHQLCQTEIKRKTSAPLFLFKSQKAWQLNRKTAGTCEMTEDKKETQSSSPGNAKCFPPMRYMVASMTFLGFANIYAMRVNLSMAIAVMVANQTVIHHGMEVQVLYIF